MDPRRDLAAEQALYEEALQIPTESQRASFLDGACRGAPDLRARMDVLLEGHFQSEGFLDTVACDGVLAEGPGSRIGRYKLLQQIGEGGFGVV